MNLLVLSTWFPYPADNGSRLRAWHLLRQLKAQGHRLHLVAGVQDDAKARIGSDGSVPAPLADLCETVDAIPWHWFQGGGGLKSEALALLSPTPRSILETPNPALSDCIAKRLEQKPDAVLVLELGMDTYLGALPSGCQAILDQVEVSGVERAVQTAGSTPARLRAQLTLEKSNRYWHKRFQRYACITAVSEEETAAVRRVVGRETPPVVVVPNGVDVAAFPARPPQRSERVPGRLLYNGALTYGPNRDAVGYFVRDILPRIVAQEPDAHLVVTGRYDASADMEKELLASPHVTLTGFVTDLTPILATAQLSVVPLLGGGGTRLKILEAWAAYLPVVSTTIGAVGLAGEDGLQLAIADTAGAFADKVVYLLRQPAEAEQLAQNAYRLACERYDWSAIGANLSRHLESALRPA